MKDFIFFWLFLLMTLDLLGQHPNTEKYLYKRIVHKFEHYKTQEIIDAIFILNGDTIKYKWDKDSLYSIGYAIPKEKMHLKNNLIITHPYYKSLVLDSVHMEWPSPIYMFQEGEESYIENGMPVVLNFGKKYIAIKVSNSDYSPKEAKKYLAKICKKHKLKIGVSYQDSLKRINKLYGEVTSEGVYGGIGTELKYIFWLEKEDNSMFDNQSKMYKRIRKNKTIEWLGVPQDFNIYVLNDFEIEFKNGTDTLQINSLIDKYKLDLILAYKSGRVLEYINYSFKSQLLIPNDDLMKKLMKETIIKYVSPKKIIYDTDC